MQQQKPPVKLAIFSIFLAVNSLVLHSSLQWCVCVCLYSIFSQDLSVQIFLFHLFSIEQSLSHLSANSQNETMELNALARKSIQTRGESVTETNGNDSVGGGVCVCACVYSICMVLFVRFA